MSFDCYFMGDFRCMRGRCFPFCLELHKSGSEAGSEVVHERIKQ